MRLKNADKWQLHIEIYLYFCKMKDSNEIDCQLFLEQFKTEEDCLEYLAEIKWRDGYKCRKCKCEEYIQGKKAFSRRCVACGYDESPTAHTLFNKCKFSLLAACHMAFKFSTQNAKAVELSELFSIRYKTCTEWRKYVLSLVQQCSSKSQIKLKTKVYVEKFPITVYENTGGGRRAKCYIIAGIAPENALSPDKVHIELMKGSSADEVEKDILHFFDSFVDFGAEIITNIFDDNTVSLREEFENIRRRLPNKENGYKKLRQHVKELRLWLQKAHPYPNKEKLPSYLIEYYYKYNRSPNDIFSRLVKDSYRPPNICIN
jgi:hypothetical protein